MELTAKGIGGQLTLVDGRLRISRKGLMSLATHGLKGDKEIQVSSISSIQWKKPGLMTSGYIQFSFMGGREAQGGLMQAPKDENTVMFSKNHQSDFEAIRDEIQRILDTPAQAAAPAEAPTASPLEKIKQLAELRDAGVISDEEFEAKKAELMARL